jgi:hypothetical protein
MINKRGTVPIQAVDRLTSIGEIMTLANVTYAVVKADDIEGNFTISATGNKLLNQAAKTINFTAASGTVYFIPGYAWEGFKISGAAASATGTVNADCTTLYKAVLASGAITVTQITPAEPA